MRYFFLIVGLIASSLQTEAARQPAEKVKKPVAVKIQPKHSSAIDNVGNVIVTYEDGTHDVWTLKGNCMLPKVGPRGQVGWVVCELEEDGQTLKLDRDAPIGSHLTICLKGKIIANLEAAKPFIEDWKFASSGDHVVVKSRAAHGVAIIQLFAIKEGLAEKAVEAYREDLPAWAKPFRDQ